MNGKPSRGEVWLVDLDPVVGHEQAGRRPCLVVSEDRFNRGPMDLIAIVPLTSRVKNIPLHVVVRPPEGGLKVESAVLCNQIRTVSISRFINEWGRVEQNTLAEVSDMIRIFLDLP